MLKKIKLMLKLIKATTQTQRFEEIDLMLDAEHIQPLPSLRRSFFSSVPGIVSVRAVGR